MNGNGFTEATKVEQEGMLILHPYLARICDSAEFVTTEGNWFLQKCYGDVLVKHKGKAKFIEIKCESKHTGNLFLEIWSNRQRLVPGWLYTCHADVLWYYFLDTNQLYSVRMTALKAWAFGSGVNLSKVFTYQEKAQAKHDQLNDTWGRIVPIYDLQRYCETFKGPLNPKDDKTHSDLRQQMMFS